MSVVGDILSMLVAPFAYVFRAVTHAWHNLFTLIGLAPDGSVAPTLSVIATTATLASAFLLFHALRRRRAA